MAAAGTSLAAPLWAGFVALANEQRAEFGQAPLGFLNGRLYSIGEANSANSAFHDVTTGSDTTNTSPTEFFAAPGYDLCTGWGSPNGANMIDALTDPISGTMQASAAISGSLSISGVLTVPAGDTLTLAPGTVLYFTNSSAALNVNGVLKAVGTAADPITFTGNAAVGSWRDIMLSGSGADNSTLQYCDIDYCGSFVINSANGVIVSNCKIEGNAEDGIDVNSSSDFLAESDTIADDNVNHGISIVGGSNDNCYYNLIYKTNWNQQGAGIQYSSASGTVFQNDIGYYNWGIAAIWGATITDQQSSELRNNRVDNCQYGLMIYRDSWANFGNNSPDIDGSNSIYSNSQYDAAVGLSYPSYPSTLWADFDYWGGGSASDYVASGSFGDFVLPMSTDPWANYPPSYLESPPPSSTPQVVSKSYAAAKSAGPIIVSNSTADTATAPGGHSAIDDSLYPGIQLIGENKRSQAMTYFESFIKNHPDNPAGYTELYASADGPTVPEVSAFFESHLSKAPRMAHLLLGYLYQLQGKPAYAEAVNDSIIANYPNTALEVMAERNNMLIDLYDKDNLDGAKALLADIKSQSNLITPEELSDAEEPFAMSVGSAGTAPQSAMRKATASSEAKTNLPKTFALSQNYPNPFNPTTVIDYQLPKDTHVTLRVYDVLGREVATLVDGEVSAGYHQAAFNGSRFASGVYFYRLTTPGFTKVMKMLLVK